jgi:hypothetical protein
MIHKSKTQYINLHVINATKYMQNKLGEILRYDTRNMSTTSDTTNTTKNIQNIQCIILFLAKNGDGIIQNLGDDKHGREKNGDVSHIPKLLLSEV